MEFYYLGFWEFITTIGGMGIIFAGVSTWIGKIIINHIVEKEKAKNALELEKIKYNLKIENEKLLRSNQDQYTLHMEVWNKLQDVLSYGEQLWRDVTISNLLSYADALQTAKMFANRGKIILSDEVYKRICEILKSFEGYYVGKCRIMELRDCQRFNFNKDDIDSLIRHNSDLRNEYEYLLEKIKYDFRQKLNIYN